MKLHIYIYTYIYIHIYICVCEQVCVWVCKTLLNYNYIHTPLEPKIWPGDERKKQVVQNNMHPKNQVFRFQDIYVNFWGYPGFGLKVLRVPSVHHLQPGAAQLEPGPRVLFDITGRHIFLQMSALANFLLGPKPDGSTFDHTNCGVKLLSKSSNGASVRLDPPNRG